MNKCFGLEILVVVIGNFVVLDSIPYVLLQSVCGPVEVDDGRRICSVR